MVGTPGWLKDLIAGPVGNIVKAVSILLTAINDLKDMKSANKELQDKVIAVQLQVNSQADIMLRLMESIDRLEAGMDDKIELQVRRESDKHLKSLSLAQ
jgi:hypothetical protein